jgi:hypothetical protein
MQQQYQLNQLQHDKIIIYPTHRSGLRLIKQKAKGIAKFRKTKP